MKSILKLFPVALGVLTLASCSNDDFFGSGAQNNGQELVPTVEKLVNADGETTRSAWTAGGKYQVSWQTGDVFRAYDNAVQAYDIYSKKEGAGITIDGAADVDAHKYAIFPGNQVSYAGWDKANGLSAVMQIEGGWNYKGESKATFSAGEVPVYHSDLPMWGPIANETSEDLQVALSYLTSVLDVCVYQKKATKVRVVAFADDTQVITQKTTPTASLTNLADQFTVATPTPLSGYFFAQLKDGGQLVADYDAPLAKTKEGKYGYALEVALPTDFSNEAHVLIPVVPATYNYLSVQYFDGTQWEELKGYADTEFKRAQVRKSGLEIGDAPITAVVSSLDDLNKKLGTIASSTNYRGKIVDITASGDIKTSQSLSTLIIPALSEDQIVNFNFPIDDTDNPLTIAGGTAGQKMTINLNGGISGNTAVTISAAGDLVLTGSITSSRGDQYKKIIVTDPTGPSSLTLGSSADFNSFSTNMDIISDKPLTIDAVDGEIAYIEQDGSANLDVNSGKVAKINMKSSGATTIDGGEVTTIEKNNALGDVKIYGGKVGTVEAKTTSGFFTYISGAEVNNLKLKNSTGDVYITDATVNSVETKALAIYITSSSADATVTTLKLENNATVTLNGGTGLDAPTAKIVTFNGNNKTATVDSYGKAVISTASGNKNTFTSTWNDIAANIKTSDITGGNIYTAAQLGGIQANTAYTLLTDVTATAAWTPVDLSGNFTADKKTIKDLHAPLFNKISGTATIKGASKDKVLTLDPKNIDGKVGEDDLGALAKEANGNVTVQFVVVDGTFSITGNQAPTGAGATNIGGMIGKANGNVTLSDVQIADVILNGHANVGGYIGNAAGGTIKILIDDDSKWVSKMQFGLVGFYTAPDFNAGTFGNFIGSITGSGVNVTVGAASGDKGGAIDKFVTIDASHGVKPGLLSFADNKNENGDPFQGMNGTSGYTQQALDHEIGYTPGTIGTVLLFNKKTDDLGNPVSISIEDINKY